MLDDEKNWQEVLRIRGAVEKNFMFLNKALVAKSAAEAIDRAISALNHVISVFIRKGVDLNNCEPGHGIGHFLRDYLNSLVVMSRLECDPVQLVPGFVAGVLHDIGCAVIPRYEESKRTVRHAEVGGLMLLDAFKDGKSGLNEAEQLLSVYSIMAHTHYLEPKNAISLEGVERIIQPYSDMLTPEKPFLPVWLPRWIDRLDTNGPCYPGRHYLTLSEEIEDWDGKEFQSHNYFKQMKPILKEAAGHQTMLSHILMYCNTQTNLSAYGKYDFGTMVSVRDKYRSWLLEIIDCVKSGVGDEETLSVWTAFLSKNIEPSAKGKRTAEKLDGMFRSLVPEEQGWSNGFHTCMRLYVSWYEEMNKQLMKMPSDWQVFPGNLIGDSRGFDYLIDPIAEVKKLF